MALVKCPECGKEISSQASSCPNCGYKKKQEIKFNKSKIIIPIIFLLVIVGVVLVVKHINSSMPNELSLALETSKDEVHNKIGTDFVLDQDKYGNDVEVYNLKWCGYTGKLSIAYSSDNSTVLNWKWEVDTSEMSNQEVENAMLKIKDKISNKYGEPEEGGASRLEYKWVTTHTVKGDITFDVGYKLIRDDSLWLHYGEVY
jgi:predicted nucleic acid-binding Zn ribbon protein